MFGICAILVLVDKAKEFCEDCSNIKFIPYEGMEDD